LRESVRHHVLGNKVKNMIFNMKNGKSVNNSARKSVKMRDKLA